MIDDLILFYYTMDGPECHAPIGLTGLIIAHYTLESLLGAAVTS